MGKTKKSVKSHPLKILAFSADCPNFKATTFNSFIDENNFKTILFITSKKYLPTNLMNHYRKDFGFTHYLDSTMPRLDDRIVCNVDSLHLLPVICKETLLVQFKHYELIVLDELESILMHMDTVQEKISTWNYFQMFVKNCREFLVFDYFLDDRAHTYLKTIDKDVCIVKHMYAPPDNKKAVFVQDATKFDQMIDADIAAGKSIYVVAMDKSDVYFKKFSDRGMRVLLHSSDTVADLTKCDIIVSDSSVKDRSTFYTSVNRLYVVLSDKYSCRETLRATQHISDIGDRCVTFLLNGVPIIPPKNVKMHTFNSVYSSYHNSQNGVNKIMIDADGIVQEPLNTVLRYNYVEKLNHEFLVASLMKILEENYYVCGLVS